MGSCRATRIPKSNTSGEFAIDSCRLWRVEDGWVHKNDDEVQTENRKPLIAIRSRHRTARRERRAIGNRKYPRSPGLTPAAAKKQPIGNLRQRRLPARRRPKDSGGPAIHVPRRQAGMRLRRRTLICVTPARFGLATYSLEGCCSIQLSYGVRICLPKNAQSQQRTSGF